jgi:hypothetical protein
LIAEAPLFAISIKASWRLETCAGRLNDGDNNPEQKNNTVIRRYIPKNMIKVYFGFCSAAIHAISAGTSVIKTKFLKSSMRHKKNKVIKILFHKKCLFFIIKNK